MNQREWLVDTADWNYEEMDWSDRVERPTRIVWPFRGLRVELVDVGLHSVTAAPRTHLRVHTNLCQRGGKFRCPSTTPSILVDSVTGSGSAAWNPNLVTDQVSGEFWYVSFNPGGLGADVRDLAEHMVIDFLAQLRRRQRESP